jgi:hypothetical protein
MVLLVYDRGDKGDRDMHLASLDSSTYWKRSGPRLFPGFKTASYPVTGLTACPGDFTLSLIKTSFTEMLVNDTL